MVRLRSASLRWFWKMCWRDTCRSKRLVTITESRSWTDASTRPLPSGCAQNDNLGRRRHCERQC